MRLTHWKGFEGAYVAIIKTLEYSIFGTSGAMAAWPSPKHAYI